MFCVKFRAKIKRLFNKVDNFLLKNVDTAIAVVSGLKSMLGSESADLLVKVIPGEWDDVAKALALKGLNVALNKLKLVEGVLTSDQLQRLRDFINGISPEMRDALYLKIASLIARDLDNERHTQSQYDAVTQGVYTAKK